jgi:recombination protein U
LSEKAVINKRSRDEGKLFESYIETACEFYKHTGKAKIEKTPEPRRVIGRTGDRKSKMICVNEKKAQPDFQGTLRGGTSIVFEAKHTDTDRIQQSRVTPEQWDDMEAHHRLGASCWVVVSFGFRSYARIPWAVWREMKGHYGRKYITEAESREFGLPLVNGIVAFLD